MNRLRRLGAREEGIALVMAIVVLAALSLAGGTAVLYSNANARNAEVSQGQGDAKALAEAGLANALSVLFNVSNNAMNPAILPSSEAAANVTSYPTGEARWWGTLANGRWTLYSRGVVPNPTGAAPLTRLMSTQSQVLSSLTQPLNNMAWNYMMSTRVGNTCDMTLGNSVIVRDPIYVMGNLCLENSARVEQGPLMVKGKLDIRNSSSVGQSGTPINEAHILGGCQAQGGSFHNPCRNGSPPAGDNVWASTLDAAPPTITPPVADFQTWYDHASTINHVSDCNVRTGTTPTFDTDTVLNKSAPLANLTPGTSYTCQKLMGGTKVAELSWNASTRKLTVSGTIYVDGDVQIANNNKNEYNGQAALYLSGWFSIGNSTELCGGMAGGTCDFTSWNPNTELLAIVAGGINEWGNSIELNNSAKLQAALWGAGAISLGNAINIEGPMIASEIKIVNSIETHTFGLINTVPLAMPGNPNVYAQPQEPENFSG